MKRGKRSSTQNKIDVREYWTKVAIDPDAEKDPDLADALRAMMAAREAVGDDGVRGALLIVDREHTPRPKVPAIFVMPRSHWGPEMTATFGRMRGDVFVMVTGPGPRPWIAGLLFQSLGPAGLA